MENWELDLRKEIFSEYLKDRSFEAIEKMNDLIIRKNGGKIYRYRPLKKEEVELIRNSNLYFCRAVRFEGNGDRYVLLKSYLSCFTDDVKSVPMWFDYADQDRGICLEYNYEDIKQFANANKLVLLPVIYDDEEVSFEGKLGSIMALMTKGTEKSWEYEWRLWKMDMKSPDIGKLMSSIDPVRIHIGEKVNKSSRVFAELLGVSEEKSIELVYNDEAVVVDI
ncbi:MAG: DUF2971 domain-containing protein [Lachnospiraceae bacterium]|nr:DUF2971 domain-containing protein [Lachnospiraceae bacterium]